MSKKWVRLMWYSQRRVVEKAVKRENVISELLQSSIGWGIPDQRISWRFPALMVYRSHP